MLGIHPLQGLTRKIYHSYDANSAMVGWVQKMLLAKKIEDLLSTMWGPRSIAKLVPITPVAKNLRCKRVKVAVQFLLAQEEMRSFTILKDLPSASFPTVAPLQTIYKYHD